MRWDESWDPADEGHRSTLLPARDIEILSVRPCLVRARGKTHPERHAARADRRTGQGPRIMLAEVPRIPKPNPVLTAIDNSTTRSNESRIEPRVESDEKEQKSERQQQPPNNTPASGGNRHGSPGFLLRHSAFPNVFVVFTNRTPKSAYRFYAPRLQSHDRQRSSGASHRSEYDLLLPVTDKPLSRI